VTDERFTGRVEEGKVVFDQPERWIGVVGRFEGQRVEVLLRRERRSRSLAQNRYWWSMVVPIFSEYTGYEKDEAHDVLKMLFLKTERVLPTGEIVEAPGSTAALSTAEFSELVERVARWMAERGVYLPPPGQAAEAAL
jgi:hypothetical protein